MNGQALQDIMKKAVSEGEIAGMNLLLLRDGEELFYAQEGWADREAAVPIGRDSIFRLYSMTKPVTAAAAMLLMERGQLDLGSPVSEYLPAFANQMVSGVKTPVPVSPLRPMVVKDLLDMTSGLVYGGTASAAEMAAEAVFEELKSRLYTEQPMTTREVADALAGCPLAYQPGSSWQYGSSADVLGAVIEEAAGMKFGDFLRQEFFGPLEMQDTDFYVPQEKRGRLVKTYQQEPDGTLSVFMGNHLGIMNRMDIPNAFESGGAGLVSTVDDYSHFAQMLLNGGEYRGRRILRGRTVEFMTFGRLLPCQQDGFDWLSLTGMTYGNLMRRVMEKGQVQGLSSLGEYGWDGWLGCYFANCPQDRLTILMMMQKKDSGTFSLTRKLRNRIFAEL
ncbi:MAG: serine hydrolase domain-containing protein [Eubacteriales bacterium]|nr:serine hydrolase domain-containing protein [Eubacteriales bacterium]